MGFSSLLVFRLFLHGYVTPKSIALQARIRAAILFRAFFRSIALVSLHFLQPFRAEFLLTLVSWHFLNFIEILRVINRLYIIRSLALPRILDAILFPDERLIVDSG